MPGRKAFPGVNAYLDAALKDHPRADRLRGRASEDSLLHEVCDLVAQAYDRPAHAAGILDAARERAEALAVRLAVADEVLADAGRDLAPDAGPDATNPEG